MNTLINNNNIYILRNNNKIYTNIIEDKHNVLLFMNTSSANKCIDFLSHHKQIYGEWPMIESYSSKKNSNIKVQLQKIPVPKRLEINSIKNSVIIEHCDLNFAYFITKLTNLDVLGVNHFDYTLNNDKIEILLKGSQLELNQTIESSDLFNFMSMSFDLLYYSPNSDLDQDDYENYVDILDIDSN